MQRVKSRDIVVPGSIANLGPGFDTLGLAVTLYLRLRITNIAHDGRGRLRCRLCGRTDRRPQPDRGRISRRSGR